MKKVLLWVTTLLSLSCVLSIETRAQESVQLLTARGNDLKRDYLRPSLSTVYVTDGSSEAMSFAKKFAKIKNSQFDENRLSGSFVSFDVNKDTTPEKIKEELEKYIKNKRIGNQIMKVWFPNFDESEKAYSLDFLASRGQYAAKENDVLSANASARSKEAVLTDLGEKLIDRSYVVFYVFRENKVEKKINVDGYLYKLNFNDEVRSNFYENYFNKSNGIDECEFPVDSVMYTKPNMISRWLGVGVYNNDEVDKSYGHINAMIGDKVPDWQIKETVAEVSPIRAKLGLKENLKTDQRFYVMENVLNDDGSVTASRVGAVRVGTKIADNRYLAQDSLDIDSEKKMTHFYQICGGGIQQGQTLVYKPDLGIQIVPLLGFSDVSLAVQYRASDLLSSFMKNGSPITGLYVYAKAGLPFGYAKSGFKCPAYIPLVNDGKAYLWSYSGGIGKEFNFFRALSFSVYAGYGMYGYVNPKKVSGDYKLYVDIGKEFSGAFVEGQARLGVNIGPNFQLFLFGEYRYIIDSLSREVVTNESFSAVKPYNAGIGFSINM